MNTDFELRYRGLNFATILSLQFELLTILNLPAIQKQVAGHSWPMYEQ